MPAQTNSMPNHVSLVISFPSTTYSPRTVNRKAKEFVIGTVSDNSTTYELRTVSIIERSIPALPTSKKNHILPVKFAASGIA